MVHLHDQQQLETQDRQRLEIQDQAEPKLQLDLQPQKVQDRAELKLHHDQRGSLILHLHLTALHQEVKAVLAEAMVVVVQVAAQADHQEAVAGNLSEIQR